MLIHLKSHIQRNLKKFLGKLTLKYFVLSELFTLNFANDCQPNFFFSRTSSFSLSPPSKFSSGLIGSTLLHKSQTGPTASPPVLISKPLSTPPNSQAHSSVIIPAENQKQEIIKWPAAIPKPTTVQAVDPFASFVNVTENPTTKIPNSAVSSGDMNFANFDAVNFYTSPAIG